MNYFRNLLKNIDKVLLILPVCFAVISVIMVGSTAYEGEFIITKDIKVQIAAYCLGAVALALVLLFDYKNFESMEKIIYAGSILFLLTVYIPGLGVEHFGSRAWVDLGPIDMQPSELVKISFILIFSSYLTRTRGSLMTLKGIGFAILYASPFILIILKEDLGSAIVMCVIAVTMVFSAGIDNKLFAKLAGTFLISMPIVYRFMESHQKERIDAFLHPENLSLTGNYQVWNSKVAIGSGGIFGKGLFQGTQKELKFLPVQKSDFIFSVIVEELGLIGGAVVIILYTTFLYRLLKIADNAKDMYGSLIAVGILAMFGFQIFENIAMTMGIMPVTGITLPFISYGGSSVVANMIALGLVLNVGIRSKIINF
ncbi:FtsW/RodA/SpoVE family cell cycle protein [Sinanaerobacter chloroacetimidivorans]|uniref:Rod shape-determining protein RodA n=1 Tax=Sinanaerobacter chloroacetimidivorans TaxID=2818044 RepID=A0A8J8B4M8_9FIRM|nr:FtsW/RodA/SpoVE family cell cycle protein [Sinanaerobacter chloroacetimidivorans]MBR0599500.1 rod shape-determining protein RodA [Sinanaerobacter chloroacetimidivorans]